MHKPHTTVIIAALSLSACIGASLLLSACGSAQTATTKRANQPGFSQNGRQMGDPSAMFTSALANLVTDGTITSTQRDTVVAAIKKSMPQSGAQGGMQPSPGATPNQNAQRPNASGMFTKALDKLVADGTITKAQKTAISNALSSGFANGGGPPGN